MQSDGEGALATLSSEGCPADLRIAGSGRVTCFAPGDMGSLGDGHTAIPEGMPNPPRVSEGEKVVAAGL